MKAAARSAAEATTPANSLPGATSLALSTILHVLCHWLSKQLRYLQANKSKKPTAAGAAAFVETVKLAGLADSSLLLLWL